jgi:hypothetical protein
MGKVTIELNKSGHSKFKSLINVKQLLKDVFNDDTLEYELKIKKEMDETLILTLDDSKYVVFLSSSSSDARNVFVSQPSLMIKKYFTHLKKDMSNCFMYIRASCASTPRNTFDIKCLKNFGVKFIGLNELTKKGKIVNISDINKFETIEELQNDYTNLTKDSKKKNNDITTIDVNDKDINIIDGKTDGANYGSLLMPIIGLVNLSDTIFINTRENHKKGEDMISFFNSLSKIKFNISSEELKTIKGLDGINEEEILRRTPSNQTRFTKNLLDRVGHKNDEITENKALNRSTIISSHIIPCNFVLKLNKLGKIDDSTTINIIESGDNGLRLCKYFDDLFDKGRISFDDEGSIIGEDLEDFSIFEPNNVQVTDIMKVALKFHRDYIYGNKNINDISEEEVLELNSNFADNFEEFVECVEFDETEKES